MTSDIKYMDYRTNYAKGRHDYLIGMPCRSANGAYLDGWYEAREDKTKTKKMKLRLVNEPPYFSVQCLDCGDRITTDEPKYADLNGPAYKAYYHEKCAKSLCGFNTDRFMKACGFGEE